MVPAGARGRGVGRALVVDSLDWARESGYAAMQFNAVVATNTGAVRLYESLGFTVVGTVPRAHEAPDRGTRGPADHARRPVRSRATQRVSTTLRAPVSAARANVS